MKPITVVVVDDHTLFRRGLIALLNQEAGVMVIGEAADGSEALRVGQRLKPDLILLDNHMPGMRGVDLLPELRATLPDTKVLMLTVSEDEQDLSEALRNGAQGYLLKTVDGEGLASALRRTMRGESVVSPEMTHKLLNALRNSAPGGSSTNNTNNTNNTSSESSESSSGEAARGAASAPASPGPSTAADAAERQPTIPLSPRELDIMRELTRGASNKEIARCLNIAETTVKIHIQHILRKLGVSSRVQAAVWGSERGLGA